MANCFFLIRSSVDGYKIIKTAYSLRVGDSGFSMSPRDVYYQFYKNAPGEWQGGRPDKDDDDIMMILDSIGKMQGGSP